MNLCGGFAFLNFVVPNRLHAGGHQVWQLLKEETDSLAPHWLHAQWRGLKRKSRLFSARPTLCRSTADWQAATASGLASLVAKPLVRWHKASGPLDRSHPFLHRTQDTRISAESLRWWHCQPRLRVEALRSFLWLRDRQTSTQPPFWLRLQSHAEPSPDDHGRANWS